MAKISCGAPRSMVTCCTPGPSSTKLPSAPFLSPSVTCSTSPMTGSMSLLVTFLPLATFVTPGGARKGSRGRPRGFCRFGTARFCGVPGRGRGRHLGLGGHLGLEGAGGNPEGAEGRDRDGRENGSGLSFHVGDY